MRKLLFPAAGLTALSVLLGACNAQVTPYAAKVGSSTISTSSLNDAMRSVAGNSGYRCQLLAGASSSGTPIPIEGKGGTAFATSFAADVLTQLVQYQAVHADIVRLGLKESAFARQLVTSHLAAQYNLSSTSSCTATGAQVLAGFSTSYRNVLSQAQLDDYVLIAHLAGVSLTTAGVTAYEATHKSASTLACTSVIEVGSKTAATAAAKQIAAGSSFASVAKSESTDSSASSGGALGCVFPSEFASPLNTTVADLATGQVSAPVQFGTSYLLLEVTSRPLASLSQAAYQLIVDEQTKSQAAITKTIDSANVSVDPSYGSWKHASSGWSVAAPAGPADVLLPDSAAVTPVAASAAPG